MHFRIIFFEQKLETFITISVLGMYAEKLQLEMFGHKKLHKRESVKA